MDKAIFVHEEVAEALSARRPVVALESTVISHGLPAPHNLETARGMEAAIREGGAIPATIAVFNGKLVVGTSAGELAFLAESKGVAKVSRADLASVVASGRPGATTVAATAFIAARAGIRVFATGGIGGVHRGAEETFDISADLTELARTPVAVVCAGAKAILDLPRTLEMLETLGVPVVGYGTSELAAFYSRESGLTLQCRVDSAQEAARLMATQWGLGLSAGIVFANPPPEKSALPWRDVEALIGKALVSAAAEKIQGKRVTPYLLESLSKGSKGKTLDANVALLLNNARVAAGIAVAYCAQGAR
ncbi:MAG: pseudouridine-5'-phosphate glycosidase [Candidatus Acidiferrales bacterium]